MKDTDIPAITTEQMVEVDRLMIESYGISLIQMMENAGRNLADLAGKLLEGGVFGKRILVLCGAGNNGGGGMVAARHLHNRGAEVHMQLMSDPSRLKDIPKHQWQILKVMGIPDHYDDQLSKVDLIIDAMIGYGLTGNPRGIAATWINRINEREVPILSLDTPSGLNTTTGIPHDPCTNATATMTLALPKIGLLSNEARPFVGVLYLADISVPTELYKKFDISLPKLFDSEPIIKISE
jgi:NAD(P)H-hydrate epimerase